LLFSFIDCLSLGGGITTGEEEVCVEVLVELEFPELPLLFELLFGMLFKFTISTFVISSDFLQNKFKDKTIIDKITATIVKFTPL
jgi:hypothetical protein